MPDEAREVNRSDYLTLSREQPNEEGALSTSNERTQNNFRPNNDLQLPNESNRGCIDGAASRNFFPQEKVPGSASIGNLPLHKVGIHESMQRYSDKRCASQLGENAEAKESETSELISPELGELKRRFNKIDNETSILTEGEDGGYIAKRDERNELSEYLLNLHGRSIGSRHGNVL